jgi:hypothetical protein
MSETRDELIERYAQRLAWKALQQPLPNQEEWRIVLRQLLIDADYTSSGCYPYNVIYDDKTSQPMVMCGWDDVKNAFEEMPDRIVSIQGEDFVWFARSRSLYRRVPR